MYSTVRTVLMIPIAAVRLILLFTVFSVAAVWLRTVVCLCTRRPPLGTPPDPISPALRVVLAPVRWGCRACLWLLGVLYLEETFPPGYSACCPSRFFSGPDAPRLITPSHHGFLEFLYFGSRYLPLAVAKAELANMCCFGPAMLALNPILVPRSAEERAVLPNVLDSMKMRLAARNPRHPPLLIFPEGTTTNERTLCRFQLGAFMPGLPVTPCVISHPHKWLNPSWTWDISTGNLIFRLVTQVYTRMQVKFLPTYTPSQAEIDDPALYAKNVHALIATTGNKVPYDFSNYDGLLFGRIISQQAQVSGTHPRSAGDYMLQRLAVRCVALRCVALRCVALRCVVLFCAVLCCSPLGLPGVTSLALVVPP